MRLFLSILVMAVVSYGTMSAIVIWFTAIRFYLDQKISDRFDYCIEKKLLVDATKNVRTEIVNGKFGEIEKEKYLKIETIARDCEKRSTEQRIIDSMTVYFNFYLHFITGLVIGVIISKEAFWPKVRI